MKRSKVPVNLFESAKPNVGHVGNVCDTINSRSLFNIQDYKRLA